MDRTNLKLILAGKAAELLQSLNGRGDITIETSAEDCEQAVMAAQREFAVVALDRDSRQLREIQAALARLDDGSFGVCQSCDEAIRPRRLEAIPWARYCVPCQEEMDRQNAAPQAALAA